MLALALALVLFFMETWPAALSSCCSPPLPPSNGQRPRGGEGRGEGTGGAVSYTHLRAHETSAHL
eukprot:1832766-Alexandrium_andersonii.AAC.1